MLIFIMASRIMFFIVIVLFSASCTSSKKIAYFQKAQDSTYNPIIGTIEAPIQPNDILDIVISSLDVKASADFNKPLNVDEKVIGYLVNSDGSLDLPMLGNIKASGFTKKQLKENITNTILTKKLLIEPIVQIRHINFTVTVLGEVANPTAILVPSEQISMVKALSLAGDLTIYGKRDNVLLIREEDGKRVTRHINLNSADFLHSPYYYLKPNDIVYVEPNKAKVFTSSTYAQTLPIVLATLTFIIIVLDKVIK